MCRCNAMVKHMQYDKLKDNITNIVFQPYFADVDDAHRKICDVAPITPMDVCFIKQSLQKQFGFTLDCDIPNVSVDDICEAVYKHLDKNSKPSHKWTRREIFSYVLANLRRKVGRRVTADESLDSLRLSLEKTGNDFGETLNRLWGAFGEKVSPEVYQSFRVYNIANRLTYDLVAQGKAIDPKVECAGMDPFWEPVWIVLSFGCLTAILKNEFEIWAPTQKASKELAQKLSEFKSYDELEEFVTAERVKSKVDKIITTYTGNYGEFKKRPNMADFIISPKNAYEIKDKVQRDFNIVVDYDITGTRLSKLYEHVYKNVKDSQELRNRLFENVHIVSQPMSEVKEKPTACDKQLLTRNEVFTQVINAINSALNREASVQTYERVHDLLATAENPENLKRKFRDLERRFDIKIRLSSEKLTVYNICSSAYKSLTGKGLAEDSRITIAEMNPLWGAINKAISYFVYLRSVLENECGVKVSVYHLSNCRTYDEYKQLIIAAPKKQKSK